MLTGATAGESKCSPRSINMLIDRGEHVLSELLLLQRARCERPESAYAARMDHLQQRCKQQRPLRSHRSPVQLHAMSGDIMSCMATVAGRLRRRCL